MNTPWGFLSKTQGNDKKGGLFRTHKNWTCVEYRGSLRAGHLIIGRRAPIWGGGLICNRTKHGPPLKNGILQFNSRSIHHPDSWPGVGEVSDQGLPGKRRIKLTRDGGWAIPPLSEGRIRLRYALVNFSQRPEGEASVPEFRNPNSESLARRLLREKTRALWVDWQRARIHARIQETAVLWKNIASYGSEVIIPKGMTDNISRGLLWSKAALKKNKSGFNTCRAPRGGVKGAVARILGYIVVIRRVLRSNGDLGAGGGVASEIAGNRRPPSGMYIGNRYRFGFKM